MANLRQLLKEYLELSDPVIDGFIAEFETDWYALMAQKLPDDEAADIMEKLLGIPDWTEAKP